MLSALPVQEVIHDIHRHREDDGGVVLGRDAVQRLEVAELKGFFFKFRIIKNIENNGVNRPEVPRGSPQ